MRPAGNRVTPEEIVAAILVELQHRTAPGYYTNYVPNVFKVYLYNEDYRDLLPLKDRIREEAIRALHEELTRLNGSSALALPLPFAKKKQRKRYEAMGDWVVEFHPNEDDDAAQNRLEVRGETSRPVEPGNLEGSPTVKVVRPELEDFARETRRTSAVVPVRPNAEAYARLSYEDDTGRHDFDMIKEEIKVGRGGPNEWVDLKLITTKDVSREHFQVRRDSQTGKFFIKDLSRFGTWVNMKRVTPSVEVRDNVETDKNIEEPLPAKAEINLADVIMVQFKALKGK
ncbi:MAG TPA: FhaA domain-containing protein [Bryobacteraceae bacterium]|jgi:hypothetical protein